MGLKVKFINQYKNRDVNKFINKNNYTLKDIEEMDYNDLKSSLINFMENQVVDEKSNEDKIITEEKINAEDKINLEEFKTFLANKRRKTATCTHCKKVGHIEAECYTKHPHLKPTINNNAKANMAATPEIDDDARYQTNPYMTD
ncbi:hypothetical protein CANARDRAFT_22016 [[Candida] arabinofermentans NRRL YB-2248]|uniref:CCHC-type domain-containing protein n=1 Tax=[Candida] arabinofermentans NRRL YB-2248 TaxID=983967 RepID=A0A1E4T2Y4_9ASCO|nr:hypothetical protein CANARDRAFT_22016 [[Candida] arabinofermentans NRRL YB-2248]